MKKLNLFLAFFLFTYFSLHSQDWSTNGNTLSTGNEFIGTPNAATGFFDLNFKRRGVFAGRIGDLSISLGVNSGSLGSKGSVFIGNGAGQYNVHTAGYQNLAFNTFVGENAGQGVSNTNMAYRNVFIGSNSGKNVTTSQFNVYCGADSGFSNQVGNNNVFQGFQTGFYSNSSNNVLIGFRSGLYLTTGNGNTFVGSGSGNSTPNSQMTGHNNTFIGYTCGSDLLTGSYNTFVGKVILPKTVSTSLLGGFNSSGTIVLADGTGGYEESGNQRLYIHSNGFTGIGLGNNVIPKSMLEIKGFSSGNQQTPSPSGLRLTNLPNTNFNALTADATPKVLSVNANGDVILVDDKQAINPAGTLSTTCNTVNFITKSVGANGNLTCSQIFDDGTSVGIGTTSNFGYVYSPGDFTAGTVQLSGTISLDVAGVTRSTGFYATSDKKFKKDINPIESALDKIMSLEGKTYNWRKDEFKDKNFTSELQYGLLAQDVQKVIPSLVIESENGDLAMNYTGLIPVLIEAVKEQNKINENRMSQSVLAPFTNNCTTPNFITKVSGLNGNLTCSQIFDNGTSVGIGSSSNFGYTYSPGDFSASMNQLSGTITLDVSGVTRSLGFYATSDKKFKKDIKPIESALDKIMSLEGKTYNWRKDEFKDKNFTSELQYGLLAQDVQKVIPSLVIESENGDLAMNYTGLIPVLIEALKEQQAQISELKQQLTDNFKTQNQDLLQFSNTKIISISPNPSNDIITVSVNIEKEVQSAALQVHDINGNVLSNLNLKERANNVTKTLQKDNFGKGIYIVSLVINGKSIDSKKIVFN